MDIPGIPSGKRLQFAIESGPLIFDLPMKIDIFCSYLKLPEGYGVNAELCLESWNILRCHQTCENPL